MSLHLVCELIDLDFANQVAHQMEYRWEKL